MKTHVDKEDERPVGKPGECFYCNESIGSEHQYSCVISKRKVRIRAVFEYEIEAPRSWLPRDIEFHRNEGSWCADNAIMELQEIADSENGCLCFHAKFEVVVR